MSTPAEQLLHRALQLADGVRGATSPNPPVGAVVTDAGGTIVGAGATQPPGGPHAEVVALRQAGGRARGGTMYVTLEPCAHHGRTPPCTQALIDAGVAAVHYAVADPNPEATGGAAVLADAGVDVTAGTLHDDVVRGPLRAWLHRMRTQRPHVTWKYAATLDGRVAAADGTSRWISGPQSRAEVHRIRARVDAVLAGTGTVLADDPQLTARDADGVPLPRQPLRVVVGRTPLPPHARVCDDAAETLLLPTTDPDVVLRRLADRGVVDVLLEGGPRLAGGFVAAARVDRIIGYLAPALLGAGRSALADAGVATITDRKRWRIEDVTMSGDDLRMSAVPIDDEEAHACSPG